MPPGGGGYYFFATHFTMSSYVTASNDTCMNGETVCTALDNNEFKLAGNAECNAVVLLSEGKFLDRS